MGQATPAGTSHAHPHVPWAKRLFPSLLLGATLLAGHANTASAAPHSSGGTAVFERKPGEEFGGSPEGGYRPWRLYYYAKKQHKTNGKYADIGIWGFYGFNPVSGKFERLDLSPGSGSLPGDPSVLSPLATDRLSVLSLPASSSSHPLEFPVPTIVSPMSSPSPHPPSGIPSFVHSPESLSHPFPSPKSQNARGVVIVVIAPAPAPKRSARSSVSTLPHPPVSHEHSEDSEGSPAKIILLAHLSNGQADEWFAYRLGAHRHEDDVDRTAEEHAVQEEAALVAHQIAEELHAGLEEVHRDFASWWAGWHGHEAEHACQEEERLQERARAMEERVDGQDHDIHDQTFGRHVAEWYWRLMHEWGEDMAGLHTGDLPHVLHAEWFHRHDLAHGEGGAESVDFDCDGWRHGYNGQAHGWWQYLLTQHQEMARLEAEQHLHGEFAPGDWHRIQLGISAYEPPVTLLPPAMAGHEIPPSEPS